MLYYGIIFRTIMESYVIGLMCTLINLYNMDFTTDVGNWTFANSIGESSSNIFMVFVDHMRPCKI